MNIREIILGLSGKTVAIATIEGLRKKAAADKEVEQKLGKVIQIARANKLNQIKFVVTGAFKKLLNTKQKASGKIVPFRRDDIAGIDWIEQYTTAEAQDLGIIDGLGKLAHKDIYKSINEQILKLLKQDNLTWRKAWRDGVKVSGQTFGPQNYVSKSPYRGFNAFAIALFNWQQNKDHIYFMTKKQILDRGGKLKDGAEGLVVAAYIKTEKTVEDKKNPEGIKIKIMEGMVSYVVYPLADTIGVKEIKRKTIVAEGKKEVEQIIIKPQTIIDNMPKAPAIKHGGDKAFYTEAADFVQMPHKTAFKTINEYYSTLFHELVHSTGNKKRIGRKFGRRFGDKDYAFEELIAELGAAYLCGVSNIEYFTLNNTAAYLKSWGSALKSEMIQDKTFFFRAIMSATKAAKFIIGETLVESVKPKVKKVKQTIVKGDKAAQMSLFGLGAIDESILDKLVKLYNEAQTSKTGKTKVELGKITKKQADEIYFNTGKNVSGFKRVVNFSDARHIFLKHGGNHEKLSGQKPITEIEFANYAYVVNAFDDVMFEINNNSKDTFRYEKQLGNYYFVVEEVLTSEKILKLKTMYVKLQKPPKKLSGFSARSRNEGLPKVPPTIKRPKRSSMQETKLQNSRQKSKKHIIDGRAYTDQGLIDHANKVFYYELQDAGESEIATVTEAKKMFKAYGDQVKKKTPEAKQSLGGTMSVTDAMNSKFDLLGLDGQYLKMIGEACKPTSFFMYGPGGSGKSTFTLKFAYYLAQKGNRIAYVAGEQFATPVFTKMLQRQKITDLKNFVIAKDLKSINPGEFDVIVIDSKDSLDIDHLQFQQLQEKYPKQSWAILSQATKDGGFTGSEKWRNLVDTMIYCEAGIAQTGVDKNRWGGKGEIKVF